MYVPELLPLTDATCADGDILVREQDDFKQVMDNARPGARIFLSEGMHTW